MLDGVLAGRLNKQIAGDLGTAEKTVKVHRGRMMKKMGVRTVADLIRIVIAHGTADPVASGGTLGQLRRHGAMPRSRSDGHASASARSRSSTTTKAYAARSAASSAP